MCTSTILSPGIHLRSQQRTVPCVRSIRLTSENFGSLPTFDLSIVDRGGRELANTTHRFLILARNDTMLRKRIAEIETQYRDKLPGGGEVDVAIAIDELQWISSLFRHERKVFSQGGEDGIVLCNAFYLYTFASFSQKRIMFRPI